MTDELIPIRLSHLLGHSGVGAIVRGHNWLVVVQDIRQWTNRRGDPAGDPIPYVERVCAALEIKKLREPPVAKERGHGSVEGICIPATRFPSWMRCPECGALYRWPWRDNQADETPPCLECKKKGKRSPMLEQLPWVLVHPKGYLADVPWHFLAHKDVRDTKQKNCKVYEKLRLIERGYEKRLLRCGACEAETQFHGDEHLRFGQGRMQPWTKDDLVPPVADTGGEDECAQVLAVNDTRVYSPKTEIVLVIPPESRVRKGTVVDLLYRNSGDRARIDGERNQLKRIVIRELATKYRCEVKDIEEALADLKRGYPLYGENLTPGQSRESEFKAFLEELPDQREDEDLVTRHKSEEWHALGASVDPEDRGIIKGVHHLIRVDRLKVIKVFKGFTRLNGGDGDLVPPDIVDESDWLPAIELYGEGIFIALEESGLSGWERQPAVTQRLDPLLPRFKESGLDKPNPLTPRFILLHTLSHLLMRQIESEGGYPAASLSERIYCATSPEPMAGILIFVAVPDVAGSLGGLAELAEPRRFLALLERALEHAHWCSLDPVCSEHEGQGPKLLNRAACHACALVPEPACEYGNALLDRGFIKGDGTDEFLDYFRRNES